MSSPEDAGSSKRRRLNGDGVVKAERVAAAASGTAPSTSNGARDSSSTVRPSPAPNGRARERSSSHINGHERPEEEEDDEGSAPPVAKRPKKEEPVERKLADVVKHEPAAAAGDDSDADPDGPIDDGDGLMADLSAEARERLAMRDADGYLPGAIVRVQLKSFLTYDFAEFFPGPYLNMILGPNGSGKSTVVNAIAIGLGWSPKILGRADDLSQFLKYGAKEAYVELELKGFAGERNLIIKRTLGKDSNKSKMELNGKHATLKNVRAAVEALNIQVGNLCSFLPQDKVSEFACMTPQELLAQTQKAAGPPQMTAWHKDLIEAGGKFKELDENLQRKKDELGSKQRAAQRLEGEVRNAKDREKLVEEITYLDHVIPFAAYTKAREGYNQLRAERKAAHNDVKAAQAAVEPFEALQEEFKLAGQEATARKKKAQAAMAKLETNMKTNKKNIETALERVESCMAGLANMKSQAVARKAKLQDAKAAVHTAQERCDARAEPEPMGNLEQAASEARLATRQIDDRISAEVNERRQPLDRQIHEKDARIRQLQSHIHNLSQLGHARLENLRLWPKSEHIYQMVLFIREDAARVAKGEPSYFKMKVFEPPCLSVDVPDRKFANAVEASMNQTHLRTIICQCQEDYQRISAFTDSDRNPLNKQLARLNVTCVEPGTARERPPMGQEELHQLGFQGFAIDFVRAPEPVVTFLEVHAGLHRTAVSLNPIGRGGLDWERVNASSLTTYVAGDTSFQTSTSRYGARTKSSTTQDVKAAKSFATSVDQSQIDSVQAQIQALMTDIGELRRSIRELEKHEVELLREKAGHEHEHSELLQRIKVIKEHQKRNAQLDQILNEAKSRYERLRNQPSDEERREQLMRELALEIQAKIKQDLRHAASCLQLSKVNQAVTDCNLEVMQVQANLSALDDMKQEGAHAADEAVKYFEEVQAKFIKQKEKTAKALDKAQSQLDELDEEAREAFQKRRMEDHAEEEGLDVLEESRAEKQAELESIGGADPTVIAKYDKVQNEIRRLTDEVADLEHAEKKLEKKIRETKDKWLPELRKLVKNFNKKFSDAMDSLDDRGEIRIREHEDYAQWAIEIMVSFRAEDKLHLLTSTHQSGGERSLSTIMYLMSMIELSNAPFSLVDEINQGMDPRAERAVHNQMVKVTCHKEAGQFFLLTPKLLQQLDYHERMRVLVVCNGEWLPERSKGDTRGKLFLRKILDDVKRKASAISV